jgi:universal stress protein A
MSIKFEKVLCPVEFEQNSAAALRFACELAQPNGRLYLLHVVPGEAGSGVSATSQLARECLEDFVRERGVTDVNPKLLIRIGDPAEAIVNVADELVVDAIVMATHGHKGFARLLLGSVAERVVREARQPVLTLRPGIPAQPKSA